MATNNAWNSQDPAQVSKGGTGLATLNAHSIQVGNGTSNVTQLALGNSGQVLQSGGASADPAYSTATYPATATTANNLLKADGTNWVSSTPASVGASIVLIQKISIVNNDTSEIFSSIPAYAKYIITFDDIRPTTNGANLTIVYSTDNGVTPITSGYTSGCNWNAYNSTAINNSNTTSAFMVCPNVANSGGPGVCGVGYLFNTTNNLITYNGTASFINSTGSVNSYTTACGVNSGFTAFNWIKVLWSSGNFLNGNISTITLYGIRES